MNGVYPETEAPPGTVGEAVVTAGGGCPPGISHSLVHLDVRAQATIFQDGPSNPPGTSMPWKHLARGQHAPACAVRKASHPAPLHTEDCFSLPRFLFFPSWSRAGSLGLLNNATRHRGCINNQDVPSTSFRLYSPPFQRHFPLTMLSSPTTPFLARPSSFVSSGEWSFFHFSKTICFVSLRTKEAVLLVIR